MTKHQQINSIRSERKKGKLMNNMEAEKNSQDNRQLEIDEALTCKNEQEQMENDIRYQNNALTEDIITSFENMDGH
jgi:hypothetical protein